MAVRAGLCILLLTLQNVSKAAYSPDQMLYHSCPCQTLKVSTRCTVKWSNNRDYEATLLALGDS